VTADQPTVEHIHRYRSRKTEKAKEDDLMHGEVQTQNKRQKASSVAISEAMR